MKKLALALVCIASLAFFASCKPEGQPTISVLNEEGYVQDGATVDVNTEFDFGFVMASSATTNKELSSMILIIDDETPDTIAINGTEWTYRGTLKYEATRDEIIGTSSIKAIVTDVAGQTATATINLTINQPAQPLIARTFTWYRLGNTITGLDEYGLNWRGNYPRDTYAKLEPKDGVKLYIFNSEDWTNTTTDLEKAALFNNALETMTPAENYFNVNVTQANMTYDDVIGTVLADGTCHLIHVTSSKATYLGTQGTEITITGESK